MLDFNSFPFFNFEQDKKVYELPQQREKGHKRSPLFPDHSLLKDWVKRFAKNNRAGNDDLTHVFAEVATPIKIGLVGINSALPNIPGYLRFLIPLFPR